MNKIIFCSLISLASLILPGFMLAGLNANATTPSQIKTVRVAEDEEKKLVVETYFPDEYTGFSIQEGSCWEVLFESPHTYVARCTDNGNSGCQIEVYLTGGGQTDYSFGCGREAAIREMDSPSGARTLQIIYYE